MHHYRIFDAHVASEVEIPELAEAGPGDAELTVRMGAPRDSDLAAYPTTFEWRDPVDATFCLCKRSGEEHVLEFPRLARFHVAPGGLVRVMVEEGADWPTCRYLLVNWVLTRALGTRGRLIVHAGAVALREGPTVAFMGNSGYGKSTLVSSFHRHGAVLVDDDTILLKPRTDGVWVIGAFAGIRLWPDSVAALFGPDSGFGDFTPYTHKQQLILGGDAVDQAPAWRRLDALFLLNDPRNQAAEEITIRHASGPDVVMAMLRGAFSLDPSDRDTQVHAFLKTGQAISEGVGVYELGYPRRHDALAEVREAVAGVAGKANG